MRIEDRYPDVLENIEFAIIRIYRENHHLLDHDALEGVQALIRRYAAETERRRPPTFQLSEPAQHVYCAAQEMCEWRLGRKQLTDAKGKAPRFTPIPLEDLLECLKRLRKSIRYWNKIGGRQGYLQYVDRFIP